MKIQRTFLYVVVCLFSMVGISVAQNAPIDFEAGGHGADWTWTVFENDTNPPLEIVTNPDMSGENTSSTVAKFTALQTGQPWAGCESMHGSDIGMFTLDETNSTIKIMVHKPVISDVGIKLVKPSGEALPEIKVSNTVTNQWEELTFDFSGRIGHPATIDLDQIVVFPDFDLAGREGDNICYFDNITFSEVMEPEGPAEAAPAPTVGSDYVISLFSDVYTDVTVDTWSAAWDDADVQDVQVEGNANKLYTNLNFAGIEFISEMIDATEMTHFHMDIWTADPTSPPAAFRIQLVDFGADGAFGGGDDSNHELTFDATTDPALESGTWVSFDIPMSDFSGLASTEHLAQLVIAGDPNTVYVDNIYFYSDVTGVVEEVSLATPAATTLGQNYPNPFNPTTTIQFDLAQSNHVTLKVYNTAGQEVATLVDGVKSAGSYNVKFNADQLSTGTYIYTITAGDVTSSRKMVLMK